MAMNTLISQARKLVIVKGTHCFIFVDETSVAPLYVIPLHHLIATFEDRSKPHPKTVTISPTGIENLSSEKLQTVLLLRSTNRRVEYQLTFDITVDPTVARRFAECVSRCVVDQKGKVSYFVQ